MVAFTHEFPTKGCLCESVSPISAPPVKPWQPVVKVPRAAKALTTPGREGSLHPMATFSFPQVATVTQRFDPQRVENIESTLLAGFQQKGKLLEGTCGRRIAVCVGSRGIAQLSDIVRVLVEELKRAGADPFIVPAMGSHGGGTVEGQTQILSDYGITESNVGAPLIASMDVVEISPTVDGVPVHVDRAAFESDGIILVNRVKPHTDFKGKAESGLMKQAAVGLGNIHGATNLHRFTHSLGYERLIITRARSIIASGKVLMGLAIIENAYHQPAHLELIPSAEIVEREQQLLLRAKDLMPSLPASQIDLLIIDRIGKNISGTGLDPNVTGRWFDFNSLWQDTPDVHRIAVLDLSPETHGNAVGMGLADFCTQRLVDKIDKDVTYLNALTAHFTVPGRIPIHFSTDRETIRQALLSVGGRSRSEDKRVIRIRDTLSLSTLEASESMMEELRDHPGIVQIGDLRPLTFDGDGVLAEMGSGF